MPRYKMWWLVALLNTPSLVGATALMQHIAKADMQSVEEPGVGVDAYSQAAASTRIETWTEPATDMTFVKLPAGCFQMGSPGNEPKRISDENQHQVCVNAFWIGTTEVTQLQWWKVMKSNPSRFSGANHPVEQVSWNEALDFASKLALASEAHDSYRLPTEAEWEYAARAGTTTPFNTGNCITTDQANYDGYYAYPNCPKGQNRKQTIAVKSFAPSAFGLYDVHGNVWEWTCSVYAKSYNKGANVCVRNKHSHANRALRGGSWYDLPHRLRSADRYFRMPRYRSKDVGFRLVLER